MSSTPVALPKTPDHGGRRGPSWNARRAIRTATRPLSQGRAWLAMFRRLRPYLARRRRTLALAATCGVGVVAMRIIEPWTMKLILDSVVLGHPVPAPVAKAFGTVHPDRILLLDTLIIAVIGVAGLSGLFYYGHKLLAAQVGHRVVSDLRLDLYRHLHGLSFAFHDRRRTGDVLTRLTSDIRFLRDIFIALPLHFVQEVVLLAGMIAVMLWMDWSLTLLALASIPGILLVLRGYQGPMRKALRRQRDREGDLAATAAESLAAVRVVQSFVREHTEVERFGSSNRRSLRTGLKATRLEAKLRWYTEVTVAVVSGGVLAIAARRVLSGALLPGDLIVFVTYLRAFNRPLRRVSRMAERSARGVAAGERVLALFESESPVEERPGARRVKRVQGEIRFDGVWFRHRTGSSILRGLELTVHPGERLALVGSTGAGKSTVLHLVPRFYDVTRGRLTLDGRDVRDLRLASLRAQIALVSQEPVLFATSVAENIGYGREGASREDIEAAAAAAGIHEIIRALPDGYDTSLGERGGTLSGGQRQCVAIARAIVKDAPIVLLDEPMTGLDSEAAAMVHSALDRLMTGRTVVLVSHQMSATDHVDRVVVLEDGVVAQDGSPVALRNLPGPYGRFRALQEEALAR